MIELFLVDYDLSDGTRVRKEIWAKEIDQANKEAQNLAETLDPNWTFFHLFRG
jgi:hypothetical protein